MAKYRKHKRRDTRRKRKKREAKKNADSTRQALLRDQQSLSRRFYSKLALTRKARRLLPSVGTADAN